MTIKDIWNKHLIKAWKDENYKCFFEEAMIEYAEYYAKLVLEKAANECVTDYTYVGEFTSKEPLEVETYVIRSSITNIELPSHE